ncbi:MAG: peptidase and in kexin sedolisin [Streptosporangiaceae bacterium]|nr:peptidase and in kexin sedolisin [Streptosporangiaceae bacterium]
MKRRALFGGVLGSVSAFALLTASLSGTPAGAQPNPRFQHLPGAVNRAGFTPATLDAARQVKVLLQVEGDPVGATAGQRAKAALRDRLRSRQRPVEQDVKDVRGTVLGHYTEVFNGVAAKVAVKDLATLAKAPGVVAVHPVRIYQPDNAAGGKYIQADRTWQDLGKTGKGVKVAIIDTGVDYTHAMFGGPGKPSDFESNDGSKIEPGTFPTAKVIGGRDFVGDTYDAGSGDPAKQTPKPDPDPLDCNGHGSHVAGTSAGSGVNADGSTYTGPYDTTTYGKKFNVPPGIAPQASILAYRVFGCAGSVSDDIMVAAMEQAMKDGAKVVNMSIGSPFSRTDEPSVQAVRTLTRAGVTVVASAGNSGPNAYITGGPSAATTAISVAALDASRASVPAAKVTIGGSSFVAQNSNEAKLQPGSLTVAVLRTSYPGGPISLGCDPADYAAYPGGVTGKLVVTIRGTCGRARRAVLAEKAGAKAAAMINTTAGYPPMEGPITEDPDTHEKFEVTIPFLGVRGAPTADASVMSAADGKTASLAESSVANPGYGKAADFTSGGPRNVDSALKPDVTAPGVSIISTGVGTGSGAAVISGTSMASPMTAGVAALVTQAHPSWNPGLIKAAIVSTADATTKISGYQPRIAGSGVVNARQAAGASVVASAPGDGGNLSFGYQSLRGGYASVRPMTLHNTGKSAVTYDVAAAFNGPSLGAKVKVWPRSVKLPAGSTRTVGVFLTLSRPAAAALPAAEVSNFGALTTIQGAVTATPRGTVAGAPALRLAFLTVPSAESAVTSSPAAKFADRGGAQATSVKLHNGGVREGTGDVYSWGISDANDVTGAEDAMDVRAAGVQSLPGSALGGAASDRALIFAVGTWGHWSTAAAHEFDVPIDTNGDGQSDFIVVGADYGAVTTGSFDGRLAAFTFKADGSLVNAWVATAPANGSTALLPVLASDLGLADGKSRFSYTVNAFSTVPSGLVDQTPLAVWDSHRPPVSTGEYVKVPAGGSAPVELTADPASLAATPVKGWLVVSPDDHSGSAEADQVGLPKK